MRLREIPTLPITGGNQFYTRFLKRRAICGSCACDDSQGESMQSSNHPLVTNRRSLAGLMMLFCARFWSIRSTQVATARSGPARLYSLVKGLPAPRAIPAGLSEPRWSRIPHRTALVLRPATHSSRARHRWAHRASQQRDNSEPRALGELRWPLFCPWRSSSRHGRKTAAHASSIRSMGTHRISE